jgi:hypothetical protein
VAMNTVLRIFLSDLTGHSALCAEVSNLIPPEAKVHP